MPARTRSSESSWKSSSTSTLSASTPRSRRRAAPGTRAARSRRRSPRRASAAACALRRRGRARRRPPARSGSELSCSSSVSQAVAEGAAPASIHELRSVVFPVPGGAARSVRRRVATAEDRLSKRRGRATVRRRPCMHGSSFASGMRELLGARAEAGLSRRSRFGASCSMATRTFAPHGWPTTVCTRIFGPVCTPALAGCVHTSADAALRAPRRRRSPKHSRSRLSAFITPRRVIRDPRGHARSPLWKSWALIRPAPAGAPVMRLVVGADTFLEREGIARVLDGARGIEVVAWASSEHDHARGGRARSARRPARRRRADGSDLHR